MSLLSDYISSKISFPIKRTGMSVHDVEIQPWHRLVHNTDFECSFCSNKILPTEYLDYHIARGYTVPRERFDKIVQATEILGFTCKKCGDEIREDDNLYYG